MRPAAQRRRFRARRGTRNAATGRRRGNPPSRRGTVGPTISFLKKETVPPGGTREKSSGPGSRSSSPKLKCAPTPHRAHGMRSHPAKIPRPKRRGLRGNMVPFPAALCAAGTPMGWTLVAPFLELPPSCAALAALANRARPAMRCRTAFPQKCRDCPSGVFSLGPLQRPVLFVPHCARRSGDPF